MLLVRYSFGYTNNIQYELRISIKEIAKALNISNGKVSHILKTLIEHNLITRTTQQNYGPKQTYVYKIILPQELNIKQ
jgi:predicted transcriptional regulator